MSELKVNKISPATGTAFTLGDSGDTFTVPSGATFTNSGTATGFGGGKLLQIVSVNKTDTFGSTSPVTPEDVTGMSVTITPSATSSKIWLTVSVAYAGSTSNDSYFRIVRGSTLIAAGDTAGSRSRAWFELPRSSASVMSGAACLTFLDSPSTTSATTYKLQIGGSSDTAQMYVNRGVTDGDSNGNARGISTITAMEIGV
tara:strand:- start:746 stop:1345 length:600 start_codon:yes stop_codon:yes gene_type:complete